MKSAIKKVLGKIERAYGEFSEFATSTAARIEQETAEAIFPDRDAQPGKVYALSNEQAGMLPGAGVSLLGNEERFTAAYYSDPLTQYAVGWTDPEDLESLTNFIAPRVPVGRRFEFKSAVNVEAFLSEINDDRAIGSNFKEVEYKGSTVYSKTTNRGLRYRMDLDEEGGPDGGVLTEELVVSRLLQRLRRNQYRRAVATLLSTAAASINTPVTWTYNSSTNANPQPDENIRTLIQQVQATSGVFPNRLLIDLKSWNIRKNAYAQQSLAAGAIFGYGRTLDDLVADQSLEGAMIAKAVYQSTEWVTPTKSYVLPQNAIAFYGQDNPTRDDPTNLKRFVTPVADGDFRVYRQPVGAKFVDISVEYYDIILATATVGLGQLTIT